MSSLIDSWIIISAFACNLLHYVVLFEVYEENLASHRYVVGNVRPHKSPERVPGSLDYTLRISGQVYIGDFSFFIKKGMMSDCPSSLW